MTEPTGYVSTKYSQRDREHTSQDDDEVEVGRASEGVAESLAFGQVVHGQEHELDPDQSKGGPSEPSVSVLKAVVEALAKSRVGKDENAE